MDCKKANLKKGMKNDSRITELEHYLAKKVGKKNKAYYFGVKDTVFGPLLDTAVRNWQRDNGLVVDGYFGPISCNKAGLNTVVVSVPKTSPNINKGTTSKDKNELKSFVFNQGDVISCGPTAVCAGLSITDFVTKSNFSTSKKRLMQLGSTNGNGTSPGNLIYAVDKFTNGKYKLESYDYVNINQIAGYIDKKYPIILLVQTISCLGYSGSYGHYLLCTGYDKINNTLKIVDSSRSSKGAYWISLSCVKSGIQTRVKIGYVKTVYPLIKK